MSTKVTAQNFDVEVIAATLPVVIDFWAPWCGPCKAIGPILETLAERHRGQVKVAKINVDEQPALAATFKIRGIPTLVVMQDGKITKTVVGFQGRAMLESLFESLADADRVSVAS